MSDYWKEVAMKELEARNAAEAKLQEATSEISLLKYIVEDLESRLVGAENGSHHVKI